MAIDNLLLMLSLRYIRTDDTDDDGADDDGLSGAMWMLIVEGHPYYRTQSPLELPITCDMIWHFFFLPAHERGLMTANRVRHPTIAMSGDAFESIWYYPVVRLFL